MNLSRLAALALSASLFAGAATAQVAKPPEGLPAVAFDAPVLERQAQAVTAFGAWIDSAMKTGAPFPRRNDPGLGGQLFKTIFDKAAIAAAPADGSRLSGMCNVGRAILTTYAQQGISPTAITPGQPPPKAVVDQMTANTLRYQAESELIIDFTLDCAGRMASLAAPAWATLPPSQKADTTVTARLRGLQSELGNLYRGGIGTVVDKAYGAPMRTTVMTAMNRNAATYAAAWTVEQRGIVNNQITEALKVAEPAYAPGLTRLRDTIAKTPCTGLCAT